MAAAERAAAIVTGYSTALILREIEGACVLTVGREGVQASQPSAQFALRCRPSKIPKNVFRSIQAVRGEETELVRPDRRNHRYIRTCAATAAAVSKSASRILPVRESNRV